MCIYHSIANSNTLPLDNKETPSIVLLSFASFFGRYFILPVPNSVSGTCLCNILRHKVSQHNFHNIHLLNVDSKFRDTEYEVRSPQESPCISIDQIISGQK